MWGWTVPSQQERPSPGAGRPQCQSDREECYSRAAHVTSSTPPKSNGSTLRYVPGCRNAGVAALSSLVGRSHNGDVTVLLS